MNYILFRKTKEYGIYQTDLNFNKYSIKNIISEIYKLENDKIYSSKGRTFILNKGFHSCNLLDKSKIDLETFPYIKILISRVQELLFNYFKNEQINLVNTGGALQITEIWINILRNTDYNLPHAHYNYDISGNFYLQVNKEKYNKTDGGLMFINYDSVHYTLPNNVKDDTKAYMISPVENMGILFQSHYKHIVFPHFSNEDRIGIAFNAKYNPYFTYDDIYPLPYWLPIKYTHNVKQDDIVDNKLNIKFKNNALLKLDLKNHNSSDIVNKPINLGEDIMTRFISQYAINKNEYFKTEQDIKDNSNDKTDISANNIIDESHNQEIQEIKNNIIKPEQQLKQESINDDYFYTENPQWNDTDHFHYEDNNSDKLTIIFSGMGGNNQPPTFIFYNLLKSYTCDKLFIRDLSYTWFLNNTNFGNGQENNFKNMLKFLNDFKKERHKKIYTIGCSAGGYAAILYGHYLNVDKCIAFAPQTCLTLEKKKEMNDDRWIKNCEIVEKQVDSKLLLLSNLIPFNMHTNLYFSNDLDELHSREIKHTETNLIKIGEKNHLTALMMKKNGMLKIVIDRLLL
jgi:uncharacterized protein (TIGR02466 family)